MSQRGLKRQVNLKNGMEARDVKGENRPLPLGPLSGVSSVDGEVSGREDARHRERGQPVV